MAFEYLKPTAFSDPGSKWNNEAKAYDISYNDKTTCADSVAGPADQDPWVAFTTWQTKTQTYTATVLYVNWKTNGLYSNDQFAIRYTKDGTNYLDLVAMGVHNETIIQTSSVEIDADQDLTKVQVKLAYDRVTGADSGVTYVYDIWTQGAGPPPKSPGFTARTETYVDLASLTTPYNITVTKPTGTVDGDILFCWIGFRNSSSYTIDSVPSGWALVTDGVTTAEYLTNYDKYAVYYKVAASEPASWVWSFSGSCGVRAVCSCYTGGDFDPADPIDVVSNTAYRTDDVNCIAASMAVGSANSPLVFWGGTYTNVTMTFTKPSIPTTDWVEDDDVWSTTGDFAIEVCSMIWSGSGATGNMSATMSGTGTAKHGFAVALNPKARKPRHGFVNFQDPGVV